jgi:hypothetical protein
LDFKVTSLESWQAQRTAEPIAPAVGLQAHCVLSAKKAAVNYWNFVELWLAVTRIQIMTKHSKQTVRSTRQI